MRQTATESIFRLLLDGELGSRVCSSVVTYLYAKRDKGHITCSVYWNWQQWKTRWFAFLRNVV